MNDVTNLTQINPWALFLWMAIILIAFKTIGTAFEYFIDKLGIETRRQKKKKANHILLNKTAQGLRELQEQHVKDVEESNQNSKKIENQISEFINEINDKVTQFTENRKHDRQQSLEIQKNLTDAIKTLTTTQQDRDAQIVALMCGTKELLGDAIDQRYDRYIALEGIPDNEIAEFNGMYEVYSRVQGNGTRKAKYLYVKNNLPIIPTQTKLLVKDE